MPSAFGTCISCKKRCRLAKHDSFCGPCRRYRGYFVGDKSPYIRSHVHPVQEVEVERRIAIYQQRAAAGQELFHGLGHIWSRFSEDLPTFLSQQPEAPADDEHARFD